MDKKGPKKPAGKRLPVKRPARKKSFIDRHIKKIAMGLLVLFLFQGVRGCVKSTGYEMELTTQEAKYDSLLNTTESDYARMVRERDDKISELDSTLDVRDDRIQYLEYELKVAGVKVQAAEDRAKAVQSTAEKVKNNTTTTIKIEADTTKNKIKN